jgi:hypothetical protein
MGIKEKAKEDMIVENVKIIRDNMLIKKAHIIINIDTLYLYKTKPIGRRICGCMALN